LQNTENGKVQNDPFPPNLTKKCVFWVTLGKCKHGSNCPYQHPPRKPNLKEILKHMSSVLKEPNIENGISYTVPPYPGLPDLPTNGICRIMQCEELVIYFIPFYRPIDGVVYFKKIRLFRFNQKMKEFKLVFSYTKQGFHITSAAASSGYLVCSRLPYDVAVLKLMEESNRLKKQSEKMRRKNEKDTQQIAKLKSKNGYLSNKLNRKPISVLREEARSNRKGFQVEFKSQKLERLGNTIKDNFRNADPVDLFVFDPVIKCHIQVLEYHKPADYVDLNGKTLHLWDKNTGLYHSFFIKMGTNQVSNYDLDEPLKPDKLCAQF